MTSLDQDQIRALDRMRTQLLTLRSSLATLSENLVTQQPLPSASALQIHANVITSNLHTLSEQLAEHQQLLSSTAVFPLPQYPGRPYGGILTDTLLRTKLEPNVQEWVEEGETAAAEPGSMPSLSNADRAELWRWAPTAANREARKQKWGADYTLEEVHKGIENIVTGLRRDLVAPAEDEDDEGEDEDEYDEVTDEEEDDSKMDIEQPPVRAGGASSKEEGSQHPGQMINGRPMYLETLQELMTTGRIERYDPKLVEMRKEAERKKQSSLPG